MVKFYLDTTGDQGREDFFFFSHFLSTFNQTSQNHYFFNLAFNLTCRVVISMCECVWRGDKIVRRGKCITQSLFLRYKIKNLADANKNLYISYLFKKNKTNP